MKDAIKDPDMGARNARHHLDELGIPYSEASYLDSAKIGRVGIVALFNRTGMPVDTRNEMEKTALMFAAESGSKAVVKWSLSAGADVNARDSEGETALMRAAENGHLDIVKLLIDAGASVRASSNSNWTALLYAVRSNHIEIVELLIGAGSDVDQRGGGIGGSVNALELAASRGFLDVMKLLIQAGARINCGDCHVLEAAASDGQLEVVKFLLAAGADLNAKTYHSRTALIEAARCGHREIVRLLIDAGAEINHEDGTGYTALMLAMLLGHKEVVAELWDSRNSLTDLIYRFSVFWGRRRYPICGSCLVLLTQRQSAGNEYFVCPIDGAKYFLKDEHDKQLTLLEAQRLLETERLDTARLPDT